MNRRALALFAACGLALCSAAASFGAGVSDEHACCRERSEAGSVAPGDDADAAATDCCEAPSIPAGADRSLDSARTLTLPAWAALRSGPSLRVPSAHAERSAGVFPPPDRTTVLRL
jgi:hypothetical protein